MRLSVSIAAALRNRVERWLNDRPDDSVLTWLFRGTLAATIAVLTLDFVELNARVPEPLTVAAPAFPSGEPGGPRRGRDSQLAGAMTFDLQADGRLIATGTIQPGTAKAFTAEIDKRGSYVKTVVLHSPGGSVGDALQMGRLIREWNFTTEVEDGGYCASSCPLVFAGGVERRAGAKATVGVHQVTAIGPDGTSSARGMDSVQRVAAECQRYLNDMGVDPQVWMHAMETPRDALHVFKQDELVRLKLATGGEAPAAAAVARKRS
jgi:hypothetical protein